MTGASKWRRHVVIDQDQAVALDGVTLEAAATFLRLACREALGLPTDLQSLADSFQLGFAPHHIEHGLQTLEDAGLIESRSEAEQRRAVELVEVAETPPPRERPVVTPRDPRLPPEWQGTWPLAAPWDLPATGVHVVYFLKNESLLRYVGMTRQLQERLRQHAGGGRTFDSWEAYRCADRASAAAFEQGRIDALRPPENRPPSGIGLAGNPQGQGPTSIGSTARAAARKLREGQS